MNGLLTRSGTDKRSYYDRPLNQVVQINEKSGGYYSKGLSTWCRKSGIVTKKLTCGAIHSSMRSTIKGAGIVNGTPRKFQDALQGTELRRFSNGEEFQTLSGTDDVDIHSFSRMKWFCCPDCF